MKKRILMILLGGFFIFYGWADQTISPQMDTALFQIKASTTFGVNMDTGATGLMTSIDQVGLWFELFQGTEKGFTDDNIGWNAQFTIQGMKWALKRFESLNFWEGTDNTYSESFLLNSGNDFQWDNLNATLFNGPFWVGITIPGDGDFSAVKSSSFSLNSLFSGCDYASVSMDQFLLAGVNSTEKGTTIPVISEVFSPSYSKKTGFISGGYDTDNLNVSLTVQSTTDWWDDSTDKNGYAYDLQLDWTTENGFDLQAAVIGGLGNQAYDAFETETINSIGMGSKLSYQLPLSEGFDLKISGGMDGFYGNSLDFEAGGAISLLWPGYSDTSMVNPLVYSGSPGWDFEYMVTSGFCTAINYVSSYEKNKSYLAKGVLNLRFTLADVNRTTSLIPRLGIMGILDISNLTAAPIQVWQSGAWVSSTGLAGIGGGLYVDYNIDDTWYPYVKYIMNNVDVQDLEAGLRMRIIDHTEMVLRYYRGRKFYQGAGTKTTGDIGNIEFSVYISN